MMLSICHFSERMYEVATTGLLGELKVRRTASRFLVPLLYESNSVRNFILYRTTSRINPHKICSSTRTSPSKCFRKKDNWRSPKIIVIASVFGFQLYLMSTAISCTRDNLIPCIHLPDERRGTQTLPECFMRLDFTRNGNGFIHMGTQLLKFYNTNVEGK
jgi:hypothetical protein